jgi:hypothetical protein
MGRTNLQHEKLTCHLEAEARKRLEGYAFKVARRRLIIKGEEQGPIDYLGVEWLRKRRALPLGELLSTLILKTPDYVWDGVLEAIKDPPSVAAVLDKRKKRKRQMDREYREEERKGWKALEALKERRKRLKLLISPSVVHT